MTADMRLTQYASPGAVRARSRARQLAGAAARFANLDRMASGSEHLRPNLHAYLVAHSSPPDALLRT